MHTLQTPPLVPATPTTRSNPPHGVHFCKRQMFTCISGAMHTLQKSSTCGASGAPPLTMNRTLQERRKAGATGGGFIERPALLDRTPLPPTACWKQRQHKV